MSSLPSWLSDIQLQLVSAWSFSKVIVQCFEVKYTGIGNFKIIDLFGLKFVDNQQVMRKI